MLVIPREKDQGIVISDHITVTVLDISDDEVRLGIDIPEEMSVRQGEISDVNQCSEEQRKRSA